MVIYLDHAATSHPKAPTVESALVDHLASIANPGRSGHRLAVETERRIELARVRLARLLQVADPRRVVFTSSGTDALHLALRGVLDPLMESETPPRVIATQLDHNAVRRPLADWSSRGRIRCETLSARADGRLHADDLAARLTMDTALVTFPHVSNVTGLIQPVESLAARVRSRSPRAVIVLDAAQSVGAMPLEALALGADLIAFPAHKGLLAPTGTGALIVGERLIGDPGAIRDDEALRFRATRAGGTGGDSISAHMPRMLPVYLEAGTPNTLGLAGLAASLAWLAERGVESIRAHEHALMTHLLDGLAANESVEVLGDPDPAKRLGVVSWTANGWRPDELAAVLDASFGLALRAGLHCAPGVHERFGTFPDGALRASVGPFTTFEEIDTLLRALAEVTGRRA